MPKAELLECFDNPNPSRPYVIEHVNEEFTSVCPKTGHPDFGTITLRYVPEKLCVELKSLKLYFQSFRNEGIYYEAVTNRIADDLDKAMAPQWMMIQTDWHGRGGIRSVITVEIGTPPGSPGGPGGSMPYDEDVEESDLDDDMAPRSRPDEDDDIDSRPPPGF